MADQDYEQFKNLFFQLTGIDLSLYKEEQMKRRLNTLRVRKGMPSFVTFFQEMRKSEPMFSEFLAKMTINVTEFFRNRQRWDILENKIRQYCVNRRSLQVWSAACSTGEEAYSLAMILSKFLPDGRFSITASDIDQAVLEKAREGRYLGRAVESLTPEERSRYFRKDGLFYCVDAKLKQSIRFIRHDLLSDPAPGKFDLVVCRNVLIYFTEEGKKRIYHKLSHSLKENGILFVGSTEQIFHPETYQLRSAETFFYEKSDIEG
ncbi:CheR family methyltransferase [Sporolactobacillus putidus]|uniref:protein-glutamate O-methyltransferase n=1 Tax=Sporolactobacillus putidus TaxID=492735 RepID=A0A917RZU8_9BACL|nr:protein-glutamate O-methyltransferase CheR [Sporolactobacillus putidus]GGL47078.1 chemotaxis protein methyltransferase [Sporolactobacillus putidus]